MKMLFQTAMIAGVLSLGTTFTALPVLLQTPTGPAGSSAAIEDGSILYAELSKTVDAKKAKIGDPVIALLLADVLSHGKIVAHYDSKLMGHVTEVQSRSKENPESRLGIAFDKIILKGGQEVPFHSKLLAIRPAPRLTVEVPPGAPAPPGVNPVSNPPQEKHYPTPKGPSPKMNTSMNGQLKSREEEMAEIGPTSIDGLSLSSGASGQAIVSLSRTVKLESGVRLELRITGSAP